MNIRATAALGLCAALIVAATATSCHWSRQSRPVEFVRMEQVIFDTPARQLSDVLASRADELLTPLLNIDPHDSNSMAALADYAADPTMRRIYHICDSIYHDLSSVERTLQRALERQPWLHYDGFYTLVTGDFYDYSRRVFCSDHELAISLDHYAVAEMHAGVPAYIERVSHREYMAADCLAAIAYANIAEPTSEPTLLDYAVMEGKVLYFLEQTLPHTPDTILMRYTTAQMRWMKNNVEQVWAWLLQNNMLYSQDYGQFHNLIDEAPKSNAFGNESAPRTPSYIGWQIVRRYMKRSGTDMQQLFEQTDSRKILTESGWRP